MANGTEQEQLYKPDFALGRESEYEDVERYRPGGFCPVDVSTSDDPFFIQDRYQVMYKCTHSHFFTGWLCYDTIEKKWRYLEINTASESSGDSPEQVIRNTLISHGVDHDTARKHGVVLPYETFFINSPNGRHRCSVLPYFGACFPWKRHTDQTDGDRVHQLCHSMARAISFLHEHGICHGDIQPGHMRLWLKEGVLDKYTPDTIPGLIKTQWNTELETIDGKPTPHAPKRIHKEISFWDFGRDDEVMEMLSTEVAIRDTGSAYLAADGRPLKVDAPIDFQAPETVLDMRMGTKSDIWALAVNLFYYAIGDLPVEIADEDDKVEAITEIEALIGPVPEKFRQVAMEMAFKQRLGRWERLEKPKGLPKPKMPDAESEEGAKRYLSVSHLIKSGGEELEKRMKEDGSYEDKIEHRLNEPQKLKGGGNHSRFCGVWYLAPEEITCLGGLLREMLKWDPDERWDAKKVMGHEWFANRYMPRLKPNSNYIPLEKEKAKRGEEGRSS
ncbi:hypothetical protein PG993_013426 [Apiospora rasikravindrae]|uniref:non-specific serine/threonine protein kinase n=1 Tax=Apiospora rasikravindrae TaxID=990691 RepID=A0ABR1RXM5_9PEZI